MTDSYAWSKAKPFVNGGLSGMMATCIIQPLDMVKVRIQLGATGGPLTVARDIIAKDGALPPFEPHGCTIATALGAATHAMKQTCVCSNACTCTCMFCRMHAESDLLGRNLTRASCSAFDVAWFPRCAGRSSNPYYH